MGDCYAGESAAVRRRHPPARTSLFGGATATVKSLIFKPGIDNKRQKAAETKMQFDKEAYSL